MSPAQYCARYGIAESTLRGWLKRGLMEGAEKCGGIWDIPEDARARYEQEKEPHTRRQPMGSAQGAERAALRRREGAPLPEGGLRGSGKRSAGQGVHHHVEHPLRRKMEHGIRNLPTWIGRNRIQIEERLLGVLEGYMQRNNQRGRGSSAPLMECRRNDQHG